MRTLVSAHMTTWAAGSAYPVAEIRSSMGQAGWHAGPILIMLAVTKFLIPLLPQGVRTTQHPMLGQLH